jgi:hypothetical protein
MDTFFDRIDDTQWGHVIMQMAVGARNEASIMRDPEAIRCCETGRAKPGTDIFLGKRQYTDDQLGKLDGPGRDVVEFNYDWTKRTPKAHLTPRQRKRLRKLSRTAKRKGLPFDEATVIMTIIQPALA